MTPRVWRRLLFWVADPEEREFMVADLEEEHEAIAERDGLDAARRWYRSQVLRSVFPCLVSRMRRGVSMVPRTDLVPDTRMALRTLATTPLHAVVTVTSLAFGIGAVVTVFTITNALLLRSPDVPEPEKIVGIVTSEGDGSLWGDNSYADYESIRDAVTSVESVALSQVDALVIGELGSNEQLFVERVTADYFETLGIRMRLGRGFLADEARPEDAARVTVISHRLWQERFAEDPGIVGSETRLSGRSYVITGVAPPGVLSRDGGLVPDAWIPLGAPEGSGFVSRDVRDRSDRSFAIVGRLADGASLESLQAELDLLSDRLYELHPEAWADDRGLPRQFTALSEPDARLGPGFRAALTGASMFMLGAGSLIVLLACANVAGLALARAQKRKREMAIRVSLGASRARLVGMLLVESLLLASGGGALGVGLAHLAAARLSELPIPLGLPLKFDFSLDLGVVAFAALVSVLATVAFGLLPAIDASRLNLVPSLAAAGPAPGPRRSRSRFRLRSRNLLVSAQLAGSVALLAGAGLFMRAMQEASSLNLGMRTQDIAVMSKRVPEHEVDPRAYVERLRTTLENAPEVEEVQLGRSAELSFLNGSASLEVPGYERAPGESMTFAFNSVTPGYLEMLEVPLLTGRTFTTDDVEGAPRVAIVNESFAARFWPGRAPIGERFTVVSRGGIDGRDDAEPASFEVVGVVRDGRFPDIDDDPQPFFWTAFQQDPSRTVVIHVKGRPGSAEHLVGVLRRDVTLEPNELVLLTPTRLRDLADLQLLKLAVPSRALTYGGSFGLLLSVIGIYGLVSLTVAARRRELAIRLAVGAGRAHLLASIVGDVLRLTVAGLALGLLAVVPVARLIESRLFGVGPLDPVALGSACAVLLFTAAAAAYLPARRAAAISPTEILRAE